jgi:ATP-binding protein involved in chromosome partitioning
MVSQALEQLLIDSNWAYLDYLVIDLPPGTGDIALSLSQYLPRGEVYVVTTPQPAAQIRHKRHRPAPTQTAPKGRLQSWGG